MWPGVLIILDGTKTVVGSKPSFLAATHLILHLLPICFFTSYDFCIFIRFYLINLSNFPRFLLKKEVLFKMWRPLSKWSVWSKTGWRRIFYLTYIFTNLKVLLVLAALKKISKGFSPKNRQFNSKGLCGPRKKSCTDQNLTGMWMWFIDRPIIMSKSD